MDFECNPFQMLLKLSSNFCFKGCKYGYFTAKIVKSRKKNKRERVEDLINYDYLNGSNPCNCMG